MSRIILTTVECLLGGLRLTGQEAIELDKKLEIDIVALGRFAMGAPNVMDIQIDTCSVLACRKSKSWISSRCSFRLVLVKRWARCF